MVLLKFLLESRLNAVRSCLNTIAMCMVNQQKLCSLLHHIVSSERIMIGSSEFLYVSFSVKGQISWSPKVRFRILYMQYREDQLHVEGH